MNCFLKETDRPTNWVMNKRCEEICIKVWPIFATLPPHPLSTTGMRLTPLSRTKITDGYEFEVTILNPVMPRIPTKCSHKLFIRITIADTSAKHDLTIIFKRNNTDVVSGSKGPRGISIVPGKLFSFKGQMTSGWTCSTWCALSNHVIVKCNNNTIQIEY